MSTTALGTRMKQYEKLYTRKAMPLLPVIARLDGKSFHTWTQGLHRPFDQDFMNIMQTTTKKLVQETGAVIGYTQSDEITLIFYSNNPESQIFFDGKLEKMTSVLASMCTACFNEELTIYKRKMAILRVEHRFKYKPLAMFDCRVFQVPTLYEAGNCLIWRELDATRNSILSVAQSKFSHKEMQGKNTSELQEMMFQLDGTNWSQDYTAVEKRGSYFRKVKVERPFTAKELEQLPPRHNAKANPNLIVERTDIVEVVFPKLNSIYNLVECVFKGAEPIIKE